MAFNNATAEARARAERSMVGKQKAGAAKLRSQLVRRGLRMFHVERASQTEVQATEIATGSTKTWSADEFLRRRVEVVKPDAALLRKLSVPDHEIAFQIAVATSMVPAERIRRLNKLRRDADDQGRQAIDHYLLLLKTGQPVRRWTPAEE